MTKKLIAKVKVLAKLKIIKVNWKVKITINSFLNYK